MIFFLVNCNFKLVKINRNYLNFKLNENKWAKSGCYRKKTTYLLAFKMYVHDFF